MPNHRTTAADFRLFVAECRRCIKRWKIVGWAINFEHADLRDGRRAELRTRVLGRVALIVLGTDHQGIPTRATIKESARHEVTHLLISPLADIISSRYLTEDEEKHANESVVRHLQELLP